MNILKESTSYFANVAPNQIPITPIMPAKTAGAGTGSLNFTKIKPNIAPATKASAASFQLVNKRTE